MTESPQVSKPRRRWLRRLFIALSLGLIGLLGLILALPWIVELPWIQRTLAGAASRMLAPSALAFRHIRVSWSRPIEIEDLVLRDAQGEEIIVSSTAHLSWNLRETLVNRPDPLTLTLDHANVDIERLADGTIDLLDTLKPILKDEPDRTILVRIVDGKLRLRAAGLNEPFHADKADIDLDLNAFPRPNAWRMTLQRNRQNAPPGTVHIQGSLGRKKAGGAGPEDLELSISGDHWPWVFTRDDVQAKGVFHGKIAVEQKSGQLAVEGDAKLLELFATGSALSSDSVRLDSLVLNLKVNQEKKNWTADRLDVVCALVKLKATGSFPPAGDRAGRLEGRIDLAALAAQIPRTLRLRKDLQVEKGALDFQAQVGGDASEAWRSIKVKAGLSDLTARQGHQSLSFRDPATLEAVLERKSDGLSLERLDVTTPFLKATGRGDVDRGIEVGATVDLGALTKRLHEWLDLGGLELAGMGKIDAHYQRIVNRFEGNATAEFKGLSASGLPGELTVRRDQLASGLKVKGAAEPSGLPAALHELSLEGKGDGEELRVTAAQDQITRVVSASLTGRIAHLLHGAKQNTELSLGVVWNDKDVMLDPLVLATVPVVGPGGQFLPSDSTRWSGKGKYDIAKDELTINGGVDGPGNQASAPAIWPSQFRLGGLKGHDAAWLEATLAGDLSRANLGTVAKPVQLAGQVSGLIQGRQNQDGWDVGARLQVHDLSQVGEPDARQVLAKDASASLRAKIARTFEKIELAEIAILTPYGQVEGKGKVDELLGSPQCELGGMLSPDWKALTTLLAQRVEPNASITGSPRAWRMTGTLPKASNGDWLSSLSGEVGVNLEQVDVFGMRLGRAPLVVRADKGTIKIDPIDSTLNSGRLHLEPELIKDNAGLSWIHLGPTSGLMDAVVNDEVSHRVLMFAAPVLDQATRVRGRVSLALSDAYFPVSAGPDVEPKVEGDVLFDAVEFMPGPLADQLLGVFRQERRPLLVLRDPVSIRIVGRTIYQEGLIIPLGNVAVIGIDGTVDFDQNLNLVASFAMVPPRKEIPVLSQILENTQLQVPISGTFKHPRINGDAIAERFKNMGVNMLDTVIGAGLGTLGRALQRGPRAGNGGRSRDFFPPFVPPTADQTPPPPQPGIGDSSRQHAPGAQPDRAARPPADDQVGQAASGSGQLTQQQRQLLREQRKARRLERRAERRLGRGLPLQ
jgi:translocation and assembly module TamB